MVLDGEGVLVAGLLQVAAGLAPVRFPVDAAEKLARKPVVHDLLSRDLMVPGGATSEDRRHDCARATDFVTACIRDRRRFSSPEQAAHALLLVQHRSVAASLALAHAVVDLLEPAANNSR